MSDIPQSKWARGGQLLRLAAQVAAKEVGARLPGKALEAAHKLTLRVEQTRLLVETLSQMKGAAMKAGQLLGLEGHDLLPPEVTEVLSKLQSEGPHLPLPQVEAILKEAWKENFAQLQQLSPTPIASASIGQVHTGVWQGKTVAVKVQFPGIANTIDSDVEMLQSVVGKLSFLTGRKAELTPLFEEIRQTLHQETDYVSEARFMRQYASNFQAIPDYIIPTPIEDLCTANVLVMDYHEGQRLKDWVPAASADDKQRIGESMMRLFLHEYLVCGLVQTDPNWGNFLVSPDGKLIVLDFGACKLYSPEFRHTYRRVLTHATRKERPELLAVSYDFGLLDRRETQEAQDAYVHMMDTIIAPFRFQGLFDFTQESYSQESRKVTLAFARALKFTPPPRELIFLHRKLGGVFQTLKRLETKLDLNAVWKDLMELK